MKATKKKLTATKAKKKVSVKRQYKFLPIDRETAKEFMESHSKKSWAGSKQSFGYYHNDVLVGIAMFGSASGRQAVKSIAPRLNNSNVLQLKRFIFKHNVPFEDRQKFLKSCERFIKRHFKTVKVILTYVNHNKKRMKEMLSKSTWKYQGEDTMIISAYVHKVNGVAYNPRTCVNVFGTTNYEHLKAIDKKYKRFEIPKRARFIRILDNKNKMKLKHPVMKYGK